MWTLIKYRKLSKEASDHKYKSVSVNELKLDFEDSGIIELWHRCDPSGSSEVKDHYAKRKGLWLPINR